MVSSLKTLAIIVNYKVSALTLKAVESVLASDSIGLVHIAVVDNSEDKDEAETLRLNLPSAVSLWVSPKNIGFGRACNLGFDKFNGELILLLNPDARLLPGCLLRLQKTLLSAENVGAVSPQIFWDERLRFSLPSSYPPPLFELQRLLDSWGQQTHIGRLVSAAWRYRSIKIWRSRKPVKVKNLSGGLVLLKRESVKKSGGLFDPRFFLYFEDTDLFVRLRKAGYTLVVEPRAKAIHHFDQCGRESLERKRSFMPTSCRIFLEKHRNSRRTRLMKVMDHLKSPLQGNGHNPVAPDFTAPFALKVPAHMQKGWLFEWSPNPNLLPSAGRFGKGPLMDFPEECWDMLAPGQYFGRLGKPVAFGKYSQVVSWTVGEDIVKEHCRNR